MVQNKTAPDYNSLLSDLAVRLPNQDSDYYAVTLTGDKQGGIWRSVYSHWVDWADEDRRIEIRAASLIQADIAVAGWREVGERCLVIDTPKDLQIFFLAGGHAVTEKNLSESEIGEWLQPGQVAPDGPLGFTCVHALPPTFRNRAPTPKLRMQVLKRDGYRCCICGRRPTENADVELHIHHVRPWAHGGITAERNLITLCHTCHNGLAPHYEPALYHMLKSQNAPPPLNDRVATYIDGVRQYGINMFGSEPQQFEDRKAVCYR